MYKIRRVEFVVLDMKFLEAGRFQQRLLSQHTTALVILIAAGILLMLEAIRSQAVCLYISDGASQNIRSTHLPISTGPESLSSTDRLT